MHITLFGAAGEVAGSSYLVTTSHTRVLVDCGMFQGADADDPRNLVPRDLHSDKLDAVVLTHAHLDHSGRLPLLNDAVMVGSAGGGNFHTSARRLALGVSVATTNAPL